MRVRVYDLQGRLRDDRVADDLTVASGGSVQAMTLPRVARDSRVFFVRCELVDDAGAVVAETSTGSRSSDDDRWRPDATTAAFELKQVSWADMTALNYDAAGAAGRHARRSTADGGRTVSPFACTTPPQRIAFFERAESDCPPTTATRSCRSNTATTTSRCSPARPSHIRGRVPGQGGPGTELGAGSPDTAAPRCVVPVR